MAQIVINEISQNYSYNVGTNSYATVALPITSCWGPGYFNPTSSDECIDPHKAMLEQSVWQRFPATQTGLEAFVSTYRGPASVYRRANDYSYQMALTLLTAGYDVLVCRICPGGKSASDTFKQGFSEFSATSTYAVGDRVVYSDDLYVCKTAIGTAAAWDATKWTKLIDDYTEGSVAFQAKYPGSFGDNLQITLRKCTYFDTVERKNKGYWSVTTHVVDSSGVKVAVENISLVFNVEDSTDSILHYSEVESKFWEISSVSGDIVEDVYAPQFLVDSEDASVAGLSSNKMHGGSDMMASVPNKSTFIAAVEPRYKWAAKYVGIEDSDFSGSIYNKYPNFPNYKNPPSGDDLYTKLTESQRAILYYREWIYTRAVGYFTPGKDDTTYEGVYDLLKDKLTYNPNRIISPGWDDQDYLAYGVDEATARAYITDDTCPNGCKISISPMHLKIMDVSYYSRCATGFIDVPHIVPRQFVHIEDESNPDREGYIQKLARVVPLTAASDVNGSLYHTHCAFFAPWGQYQYVGTSKMNVASPSFLALMIQRAQILNQSIQYEWALPTNRKNNLRIGKLDYTVPKKLVDQWQKLDGVSVNIIMRIPDLNVGIWGNSTLFEVPPATYQALANLSTRYLVNAVEDVVYRVGLGITFQYNNDQAYNKFYAGVTPLLDTMKNVGAIDDYYVRMSADINGLDQVNANTVIGKIYLVVNGVINDIIVDLVALPPGTDLSQYRM